MNRLFQRLETVEPARLAAAGAILVVLAIGAGFVTAAVSGGALKKEYAALAAMLVFAGWGLLYIWRPARPHP